MTSDGRGPGAARRHIGEEVPGSLDERLVTIVREEVRHGVAELGDTLQEEVRRRTRWHSARMHAGAAAAALYGGGVLVAFVVLALATALPDWAALLIVAVLLGVLAAVLRNAARRPPKDRGHATPTGQAGAQAPPPAPAAHERPAPGVPTGRHVPGGPLPADPETAAPAPPPRRR